MSKNKTPPLIPLRVGSRLYATHSLAWSCDGELAVAGDDSLHIYLPHFRDEGGHGDEGSGSEDGEEDGAEPAEDKPWFLKLSPMGKPQYSTVPLRLLVPQVTDPRMNQRLLAKKGATITYSEDEDEFMGAGVGVVTGVGSALNQVVSVQWSPTGVGPNLRPVVTALLTKGYLLAYGEVLDRRSAHMDIKTRDFRFWKLLWGIGATIPLADASSTTGFSARGDKITSFSWSHAVAPGQGLLAYKTDAEELLIMAVQYLETVRAKGTNSDGGPAWKIDELARIEIPGPHQALGVHDPDYTPSGSGFSLKWGPWLVSDEGSRTSVISYIAPNYVGFKRVVLGASWERGELPKLELSDKDILGICTHLSTDAFLEWEDTIWDTKGTKLCRGVIATPFLPIPFELDLLGQAPEKPKHHPRACNSLYPATNGPDTFNPISGTFVPPNYIGGLPTNPHSEGVVVSIPPPSANPTTHPVPIYTLTRLSATSTNANWFQHNDPISPFTPPTWATAINKLINASLPESTSQYLIDSESDSDSSNSLPSDFGEDEDEVVIEAPPNEATVKPQRARIWSIAHSPGASTTAILYSKHSTLIPDRVCRSRVAFDTPPIATSRPTSRPSTPEARNTSTSQRILTSEAKVWEWMYSGGPAVPGFSTEASPKLAGVFSEAIESAECPLCTKPLELAGKDFICSASHMFSRCVTSGLPILAPATFRLCGLCGRANMLMEELLRVASEHGLSADVVSSISKDLCNGCGGKFVL
ncbi:hypothetical protein jhhlp_005967 [Lomentospora prolificans]|uniref:Transcription factor IIIC putative zinc-finger domain-containing protein n=1 Tax=Lomentospora prolificans TaxID=41688 RepID=A0A2N3N4L6_9PEZI|nr:hypothetical protein jhhlp_005967 [Lomentospora prolificans]